MPHGGLALANSLATFLEMGALLFFMRRGSPGWKDASYWRVCKALLAGGGMALILWGWLWLTRGLASWIIALGGIVIGTWCYSLMVMFLRVPELQKVISVLKTNF